LLNLSQGIKTMDTIDFGNTEIAFKIRSNKELRKAYYLFKLISFPSLVKIGNFIIGFAARIGLPVNWIVKPTVYRLFVGGENIHECQPAIERLASGGVYSILDYSVEGKEEETDIQKALEETLKAVDFAGENPDIPFAVFKPTAFIQSEYLEILSQTDSLASEVQAAGNRFKDRVNQLCNAAFLHDKPILIDAEDTSYQKFIDDVVYQMQKKYNKEKAIVFNTYQMYRNDRLDVLKKDHERAVKEEFFLGAKFVRGAYMERERKRAEELNYPDPIHKNKEATDKDYNFALEFSVKNIERISIFNGTHNEYSNFWLTQLMKEYHIDNNDKRIWFSQLFGMSDHISFNLATEKYNVAKYVPYGPVRHVLPYLTRRAEENTSVKGQTGRELSLISKELKRRKQNKA
jgi:proline dehydrogenase